LGKLFHRIRLSSLQQTTPLSWRWDDNTASLQNKNARVKLLIQIKFAQNMAKMTPLLAMTN